MLTYHRIIHDIDRTNYLPGLNDSEYLLFDIETTGLSKRASHLYLAGAAYYKKNAWHLQQWFLQKPTEEPFLLKTLQNFLKPFHTLVHFNGLRFDIPYLNDKYTRYQLDDPFSAKDQIDLYREIRPFQKPLELCSLKQRDLQAAFHVSRKDHTSGGDLIKLYQDYLSSNDQTLLQILCGHNADDVLGMIGLLPLRSYKLNIASDIISPTAIIQPSCLLVSTSVPYDMPKSLTLIHRSMEIRLKNRSCSFHIPIYTGEMKHFYTNYKDYYYLPDEDHAIHKSIGCYVDRRHRLQAKASTCYQKKTGNFLPCPDHFDQAFPVFSEEYKSCEKYILCPENLAKNQLFLSNYLNKVLHHFRN